MKLMVGVNNLMIMDITVLYCNSLCTIGVSKRTPKELLCVADVRNTSPQSAAHWRWAGS